MLKRMVNNIENLKKMDAEIKNGNSSLYNVQMSSITAFENHPILEDAVKECTEDAAMECTEQLKVKFQELSVFYESVRHAKKSSYLPGGHLLKSSLNSLFTASKIALNWIDCLARAMQEDFEEKIFMMAMMLSKSL